MVVTSTTSTTLLSFPTRRSSDLVVLFVGGLGVGFVTLRYPLEWLLTFSDRSFVEIITADNYFTFVAYFLLAFGLTFELPLVVTALVVVGVVSPDGLRTHRASILMGL